MIALFIFFKHECTWNFNDIILLIDNYIYNHFISPPLLLKNPHISKSVHISTQII